MKEEIKKGYELRDRLKGYGLDPKVTNIEFYGKPNKNFISFVSVTFSNNFAIHNMKLVKLKNDDIILAMPSRRTIEGEYLDLAHPINKEYRKSLELAVIREFAFRNEKIK